jgi:hypothetical protein
VAGNVRWVPPPVGGAYHGFRISIAPGGSGSPAKPFRGGDEEGDGGR